MTFKEWGLMLLLSFIWGASFFFTNIILQELSVFTTVAFRVSFGALFFYLILWFKGLRMPLDPTIFAMFFVMGLFNNAIPFFLITKGQTYIASSLAAILNASAPFFTIFIAHFFTKDEKIDFFRLGGILLGIVGVAIVIGWDNFSVDGLLAQLAVISSGIFYGCAAIFGKKFYKKKIHPMVIATGQLTASSFILLTIVIFFEDNMGFPSWETWAAIFSFAFFCTTLAYIIFFYLLASAGANNTILVTLIIPVSAIILGVVFLDEILKTQYVIGLAIISIALLIIDKRIFFIFKK